ncbi:MAG: shikimate dehydrogenase [Magnetococcales bacterium]|nr:shikimate dehydrogenase [Magnetococcales bacterium]
MAHPSPPAWEIDGATRLLGVIGDPIGHSLSPAMHNLALRHLGLNYRYLPFHVRPEHLIAAVQGFAAQGARGFNATVPHKEGLIPLMADLSPEAQRAGAVNTVVIDDEGRLHGHNTDGYGFLSDLAAHGVGPGELEGKTALAVGAGGACRAVAAALLQAGVTRLILANRTLARAERLAEALAPHFPDALLEVAPLEADHLPLEECRLLVNATTLGLHGEALHEVDPARLPPHAVVHDIVYGPPTPLWLAARQRGLVAIDGLGMLIHQGAAAFKLWTGLEMPVPLVESHLRQLTAQRMKM